MTHPLTNSYMTHRERERDYHDYHDLLLSSNEGTLYDTSKTGDEDDGDDDMYGTLI